MKTYNDIEGIDYVVNSSEDSPSPLTSDIISDNVQYYHILVTRKMKIF